MGSHQRMRWRDALRRSFANCAYGRTVHEALAQYGETVFAATYCEATLKWETQASDVTNSLNLGGTFLAGHFRAEVSSSSMCDVVVKPASFVCKSKLPPKPTPSALWAAQKALRCSELS